MRAYAALFDEYSTFILLMAEPILLEVTDPDTTEIVATIPAQALSPVVAAAG